MNWKDFVSAQKNIVADKETQEEKSPFFFLRQFLLASADLVLIFEYFKKASKADGAVEVRDIRRLARRAVALCKKISFYFNHLTQNKYPDLSKTCESIGKGIDKELDIFSLSSAKHVFALSELDSSMSAVVGGKSANLGEVGKIFPGIIPRGFAIAASGAVSMFLHNRQILKKILLILKTINFDDAASLQKGAANITELLNAAILPDGLLKSALKAWEETFGLEDVTLAIRSSAIGEDGAQSFAGQYESVLGVKRENLPEAIKKVIGSLYSERALSYRWAHGYPLTSTDMGICCIEMIDPAAAGVAFSINPVDPCADTILINAVWGLGGLVVHGEAPSDQWQISRSLGEIIQKRISCKEIKLVAAGGSNEPNFAFVEDALKNEPCLTDSQVKQIAKCVLSLEKHFHCAQDMEWAIDQEGQIFILQTRPLGIDKIEPEYDSVIVDDQPILKDGDIAASGIGSGAIVQVETENNCKDIALGSIILTKDASPNLTPVLIGAAGVLVENGSLTGHLAAICRELRIPAIFNLPFINTLRPGQIVTMDAFKGCVYSGEIKELLTIQSSHNERCARNSPGKILLRRLEKHILPCQLAHQENLCTDNISNLYDLMLFCHEKYVYEINAQLDKFINK